MLFRSPGGTRAPARQGEGCVPPWMPCDDRQAPGPSRSRFSQLDDSIVHKGVEMTDQDNGTWKGSNIIMARLGLFDWEILVIMKILKSAFFNVGIWINLLYRVPSV